MVRIEHAITHATSYGIVDMKRIIKGATYNTDTATKVAVGATADEDRGEHSQIALYQTPGGVYFLVEDITTSYFDRHGDPAERFNSEWSVTTDVDQARKWCEDTGLNIIRDFDDMPPEAGSSEPATATVHVRVPPVLKTAIEERAKADGVSANVFALRCFERCLKDTSGSGPTLVFGKI
jgi:hypothetical protein